MTRKMISVKEETHAELNELASKHAIPMTEVIRILLENQESVNWKDAAKQYEKPSWKNIDAAVKEKLKKYPNADTAKLAKLTGYSEAQVAVVTHENHRRVIEYLRANPRARPDRMVDDLKVTPAFAKLMKARFKGDARIPSKLKYLFKE